MLSYFKDFDVWNIIKKNLQKEDKDTLFRNGEVRWVSLGVNLGSEIDGKGAYFSRPCLILHLIGKNLALVVPMSTKLKKVAGYIEVELENKKVSLCISQIKTVSQKRIFKRIGKFSDGKIEEIKKEVKVFYNLE